MEVRQEDRNTRELTRRLMSSSLTLEESKQETTKDKGSATEAPRRLLIVDDSKDARQATATLLRELGHVIETAGDCSSALLKALEFRPQAMLIDIVMPGGSGFKLAEDIRKNPLLRNTLLITLTGWDDDMDLWLSEHAGCDYHLTKPLDVGLLESYLKRGRKKSVRLEVYCVANSSLVQALRSLLKPITYYNLLQRRNSKAGSSFVV
jgi:CheY-like chemotaxis protein